MRLLHPQSQLSEELSTHGLVIDSVSVADHGQMEPGQKFNGKTILISDILEPIEVVRQVLETGTQHLVQKNKKHFIEDIKSSGTFIQSPHDYFRATGPVILGTKPERSIEVSYRTSLDKPEIRQRLAEFLAPLQSQNVLESSEAIVEELYMNSMLDAPREAARRGQTNCTYDMGLHSIMRMDLSPDRLVISCEDPFGSLDVKKFLSRMKEVYAKGAGESINFREGGAGLGCVIMFEHSESLYLGVIPGLKTLVACVVPVGMSYRQRAQQKKSLHLITSTTDNF